MRQKLIEKFLFEFSNRFSFFRKKSAKFSSATLQIFAICTRWLIEFELEMWANFIVNKLYIQQYRLWVVAAVARSNRTEQSIRADKRTPATCSWNTSDIHSPSRELHIHNFPSQIPVSTGKTLLDLDVEKQNVYSLHDYSRALDRFDSMLAVHMTLVGTRRILVHMLTCILIDHFCSRC